MSVRRFSDMRVFGGRERERKGETRRGKGEGEGWRGGMAGKDEMKSGKQEGKGGRDPGRGKENWDNGRIKGDERRGNWERMVVVVVRTMFPFLLEGPLRGLDEGDAGAKSYAETRNMH